MIATSLRPLTPHLCEVAQLGRQLAAVEARAAAAERALDQLGTAMLVVDRAGRLVHATRGGEHILAARDGLGLSSGRIIARHRKDDAELRRLVVVAADGCHSLVASPSGVMRVTRPSGLTSYEVLASPFHEALLDLGRDGPMASVFIRDPESPPLMPAERLRRLYGLTPAEARLTQRLLAGETLDAVAKYAGVSRETARSQLKAVFRKIGVSSQSGLMRLGLGGIARL